VSDQPSQESKRPGWLNLTTFILVALGFLGGFATNYATRAAQLDTAIGNIAALSVEFKGFLKDYTAAHEAFLKEYNAAHEETAISIKALNQHLEYTDRRVAELEARFAAAR
jgi:hypothetical protein